MRIEKALIKREIEDRKLTIADLSERLDNQMKNALNIIKHTDYGMIISSEESYQLHTDSMNLNIVYMDGLRDRIKKLKREIKELELELL